MLTLTATLHLIHARAQWMVLVLVIAFVLGESLSQLSRFELLLARGRDFVARFGRKLDRKNRGIATLVYRGIVAVALLITPALIAGLVLEQHGKTLELPILLLLVLLFGHFFATSSGWQLWQRARSDHTPLELPQHDYLFPDAHAVLRYSVESRALHFAAGIVGASFWYVLLGLPALFAYLTLATAARSYRGSAFGWAARSLFRLVDIVPRTISVILYFLASIFVPGARPFASLRSRSWRDYTAQVLGVTLGGTSPTGALPWVGDGTPRLTHTHLRRALMVNAVASLWLLLLLASPEIAKVLKNII